MNIAISTGTFFNVPFRKALDAIKRSGFEYIELLQYWKGGDSWEMAQHLESIAPKETLKIIKESGLKISSLHDGGGVIEAGKESVIAKSTYEFIEYGNDDIPCIVFHVPHKKTDDKRWRDTYKSIAGSELGAIKNKIVCIENMPAFEGFEAISSEPNDLFDFAITYGIYVNIDTTHYAQMGVDIVEAANVLKELVRTVHLSDYLYQRNHVYLGDGVLDLTRFINQLDTSLLHAVTIECDVDYDENNIDHTLARLANVLNIVRRMV